MSMQHSGFQHNAFQVAIGGAAAAVSIGWFMPLSEPVRAPKRTAHYRELFASPIPVVPFSWFRELSPPRTLAKRGLPTNAHLAFTGLGNPIVPFGWFEELFPPKTLARNGLSTHLQMSFTGDLFTRNSTIFAASAPGSGPVFTKTIQYQAYAFVAPQPSAPETITIDKWYHPLAEPVRKRPKVAFDSFHFFQPTPIISIGWFNPLAEPMRARLSPPQPYHFLQFTPAPPVIFDWFLPLSEPARVKVGLSAKLQQTVAQGSINDLFRVSSSTGPLFMRKIGGRPQVYWKGRTQT